MRNLVNSDQGSRLYSIHFQSFISSIEWAYIPGNYFLMRNKAIYFIVLWSLLQATVDLSLETLKCTMTYTRYTFISFPMSRGLLKHVLGLLMISYKSAASLAIEKEEKFHWRTYYTLAIQLDKPCLRTQLN